MNGQVLLNLDKAGYGNRSLFTPFHAKFYPGQCSVLVGPGGSGKTTLLKLIGSNNRVEDFWFEGQIKNPHTEAFLLPQHFSKEQIFHMDAIEIARLQKMLSVSDDLVELLYQYPGISYQEIQKPIRKMLFFCKFLISDAFNNINLILLDEPEAGLSDQVMEELIRLINQIKRYKVVVISSHHVAFTQQVSDQVFYIKYGNLIYQAPTHLFFDSQNEEVQYLINMGC